MMLFYSYHSLIKNNLRDIHKRRKRRRHDSPFNERASALKD